MYPSIISSSSNKFGSPPIFSSDPLFKFKFCLLSILLINSSFPFLLFSLFFNVDWKLLRLIPGLGLFHFYGLYPKELIPFFFCSRKFFMKSLIFVSFIRKLNLLFNFKIMISEEDLDILYRFDMAKKPEENVQEFIESTKVILYFIHSQKKK